jgi:glutamate/aspartate transport system substrate-binding protein
MRSALIALALLASVSAQAEDLGGADLTAPPAPAADALPDVVTGTLEKARATGTLTLGYRESVFPFSFLHDGQPRGYSMDLCQGVVDEIARELQSRVVAAYAPVNSANRFDELASGHIDIECGSTTENVERRKVAAFSPLIFVAGVKLMTRADSSVAGLRDLAGKKLAVVSGATAEKAMQAMNDKYKLGFTLVSLPGYDEGYASVEKGEADAFAADDVLLSGLIASHHGQGAVQIVGDFLTYEPYGLMFRKDDPLMAAAVTRAFAAMAADGALQRAYRSWFLGKTPTGETVGLPMSAQLSEAFRAMGADGL